jgi:hypothetical protein
MELDLISFADRRSGETTIVLEKTPSESTSVFFCEVWSFTWLLIGLGDS